MAKNDDFYNMFKKLLDEINKAIDNSNNVEIQDSLLNETVVGGAGVATGAAVGLTGLFFGGTTGLSAAGITSGLAAAGGLIGGGMVAGIGVLAAPAVLLGIGGVKLVSKINKDKNKKIDMLLFKESLVKLKELFNELENTSKENTARIQYLMQLIILLKGYIQQLEDRTNSNEFRTQYMLTLKEEPILGEDNKDNSKSVLRIKNTIKSMYLLIEQLKSKVKENNNNAFIQKIRSSVSILDSCVVQLDTNFVQKTDVILKIKKAVDDVLKRIRESKDKFPNSCKNIILDLESISSTLEDDIKDLENGQ